MFEVKAILLTNFVLSLSIDSFRFVMDFILFMAKKGNQSKPHQFGFSLIRIRLFHVVAKLVCVRAVSFFSLNFNFFSAIVVFGLSVCDIFVFDFLPLNETEKK